MLKRKFQLLLFLSFFQQFLPCYLQAMSNMKDATALDTTYLQIIKVAVKDSQDSRPEVHKASLRSRQVR